MVCIELSRRLPAHAMLLTLQAMTARTSRGTVDVSSCPKFPYHPVTALSHNTLESVLEPLDCVGIGDFVLVSDP